MNSILEAPKAPTRTKADLTSRAMLVSLKIGQWNPNKVDDVVTSKVAADFEVTTGAHEAGRYIKHLISSPLVNNVKNAATRARRIFWELSLPWGDKGDRIVTARGYIKLMQELEKAKAEFWCAVDEFVANYDSLVQEAAAKLGKMYNPNEYPPAESIRYAYRFEIGVSPVPSAGDFRVHMDADEVEAIRQKIEKETEERLSGVRQEAMARMGEKVRVVAERLADGPVKDAVIDNLRDEIQILQENVLGITDAPELESVIELASTVAASSAEEYRSNKELRAQGAEAAKSILGLMEGFLGG